MTKLIILRGNSGSGKSSVARAIQERVTPHPVLIEHDYIRRKVLKEKEGLDAINADLIYRMIEYAFENDRDVILEGIMRVDRYATLFDKLLRLHPSANYFYYFDIPFEETLSRHATKGDVGFGVEEMRRWYKEGEESGYEGEVIIHMTNSFEDTVTQIIQATGLSHTTK
jgi:adenylate kinase family enzyme